MMTTIPPVYAAKLRTLPPTVRSYLVEEWTDPTARSTVIKILNSPDPTRALAREISYEVRTEVRNVAYLEAVDALPPGLEGFGKSFKRITRRITKPIKKIRRKIHKKVPALRKVSKFRKRLHRKGRKITKRVAKRTYKAIKKVGKKVMPVLKKYGPIIISVAGAVLAPFTGGLSLAAAALVTTSYKVARQRKEAKKIKRAQKKEAAAMMAEVAREEKALNAQADQLFEENKNIFAGAGITSSQWYSLSVQEKIAVIEKINSGEMPAVPEAADATAAAEGVPAPPPGGTWQQAIQKSPVIQAYQDAAAQPSIAPVRKVTPSPQNPTGEYEVYSEGQKIATVSNPQEAAYIIERDTVAGDRVEVFHNGQSTGLKLRTSTGLTAVPRGHEGQVRALSHDQTEELVGKAEGSAKAKKGGIPWGVVLAAGGIVAAVASAA